MANQRIKQLKEHSSEKASYASVEPHLGAQKPVHRSQSHSGMACMVIALILLTSALIATTTGCNSGKGGSAKVVLVKAGLVEGPYQGLGTGYWIEGKVENVGERAAVDVVITPVCPDYGAFEKASKPYRINHIAPGRQEEFEVLIAFSMIPFTHRPPDRFMKCDLKITFDEAK